MVQKINRGNASVFGFRWIVQTGRDYFTRRRNGQQAKGTAADLGAAKGAAGRNGRWALSRRHLAQAEAQRRGQQDAIQHGCGIARPQHGSRPPDHLAPPP